MNTFEVRVHGRGGQGAVTAAELLSVAAFLDGREAQAFPSFGSERTGAPVAAYCRISDAAIRTREPVVAPTAVAILDPTLLHHVDVFDGLAADGFAIVSASVPFAELRVDDAAARLPSGHATTVAAGDVSRELLGRPLPNVGIVAGMAALTGIVTLGSILAAIEARFAPETAAGNHAVARRCYELVEQGQAVSIGA